MLSGEYFHIFACWPTFLETLALFALLAGRAEVVRECSVWITVTTWGTLGVQDPISNYRLKILFVKT